MSTSKEVVEAAVKLVISIAISIIAAPLLLICGANFVLEGIGVGLIPYTLGSYFGALLLRVSLLKVSDNE